MLTFCVVEDIEEEIEVSEGRNSRIIDTRKHIEKFLCDTEKVPGTITPQEPTEVGGVSSINTIEIQAFNEQAAGNLSDNHA